jgi:hypothetical protein
MPTTELPAAGRTNVSQISNDERYREARRKGVRRTTWIAAGIAVAIFLLSILQMLKI